MVIGSSEKISLYDDELNRRFIRGGRVVISFL